MSGIMQSSQFNRTTIDISKNIKIMAGFNMKTFAKEFPSIIKKEATDLLIDKFMPYEGPGPAPSKEEGGVSQNTRLYEGYIETYKQKEYSYELPVTWAQRKFATKNVKFVNMMGEFLGRSMMLRYEYLSAAVLDNGFTAGAYAGGDGKAYFASDHAWKSGGTYDNLLTTADLSKTSLEAAIIEIGGKKMENDIPASLVCNQITIGTENMFTLPELLKSTLDPETANNTINYLKEIGLSKFLSHYISDTDSWYIDTQIPTRILKEGSPTQLDSYMDNATKNLIECGHTALGAGFQRQLGSYGNQGS